MLIDTYCVLMEHTRCSDCVAPLNTVKLIFFLKANWMNKAKDNIN